MLLPSSTSSIRPASSIGRSALLALVCTACADDVTCVDLANCTYPEADAGTSNVSTDEFTNSSAFETASASPGTSISSSEDEPGSTTAPSPPAVGSTSSAEPTSSEPTATGDSTSPNENTSGTLDCLEANTCECAEGEVADCWETPDGAPITDNPDDAIGDCKLGKRTCTGGTWGACIGAIAPEQSDSCERPLADENCNGLPNEGCDCTPNETRACGTDEGPCVAGVQTCQENGQWQPLCAGEVSPAPEETCAEVADANCNGEYNDGCECVGDEVEACNDCGERRCNSRTGMWGACVGDLETACTEDGDAIRTCDSNGNWQVDTCSNSDEIHCDVACVSSGGSASCEVSAKDDDDDGFGSVLCSNAPGTDCDDSTNLAKPGAAEVCDGVDNDCDGMVDLSDGLSLVGSIKSITNRNRVAVAPTNSGFFALVGTSPTDEGLFYGSINASGTGTFGSSPFFTPPVSDEVYHHPQIAWANGLGVIYSTEGPGGKFANAGITINGTTWEDIDVPGEGTIDYPRIGDISARGQGDLLMVGVRPTNDTIYLSTHSEQGDDPLTSSAVITGSLDSYLPHLASNGEYSGLLWQTTSPRSLNWSLVSPALELGESEQLSDSAFYADVSSIEGGYGLAWIEGAGFKFMIKNTDGVTECTSNVIPFGTVAANQEVAITDSAHGVVVVATSPDSNAVHLYRFDANCTVIDDIAVSTSASAPKAPSVARSGSNVVIYWTEGSTGRYRFVSDLLCH